MDKIRIILLDSGPLGIITNPKSSPANEECARWLDDQLARGNQVLVPAIADYEVRRELIRAGKIKGLAILNAYKRSLGYLPLNTTMMLKAADFWAQARRLGKPTAPDAALDGDVILAAQGAFLQGKGYDVVIATNNVKHLELFIDARLWSDII